LPQSALRRDARIALAHSQLASRTLVDVPSGVLTSSGNAPLAGDITPNPYSSRPSRGVYGSGI
jgi:hypothetical protein